ncbi:hypothetical protein [Winogradskyella sp. KYW1333]|uniref:hypothetical protein n=1 Tax=Winogradskyella sp. KYW1333 TaxID=2282123 RepID=UPI000DF38B10|nr:hypothetical protein [Winogradskyella sp. KYW1333]RCT56407.1 hypothetical protein DUZ96_00655 [Winogradskyella sp. KYW1333]
MSYTPDSTLLDRESLVFPLNFVYFKVWLQNSSDTNNYNLKTNIGFQYSHHLYHQNGTIQHANQTLVKNSNYLNFFRALQKALESNQGSVIMHSLKENKMISAIVNQIYESNIEDRADLFVFGQKISIGQMTSPAIKWSGNRAMADIISMINQYGDKGFKALDTLSQIIALILKKSEKLKKQYAALSTQLNLYDSKGLAAPNTSSFMSDISSLYTIESLSQKEVLKQLLSSIKLRTLSMVIIYKYLETLDHECI